MPKELKELVSNDFSLPRLSEYEGKEIEITSVRFGDGKFGEYAVIRLVDGTEVLTSSSVVIQQLHQIQKHLIDDTVKAKVVKVKRYYKLE